MKLLRVRCLRLFSSDTRKSNDLLHSTRNHRPHSTDQTKFVPVERDEDLVEKVKRLTEDKGLKETVLTFDKQQRDENLDVLKEEVVGHFLDEEDPENETLVKEVYAILNDLIKEEVRRLIADEKYDLMDVK